MDTLEVTSLRWLGIEMVRGCLFVARDEGNDVDDGIFLVNLIVFHLVQFFNYLHFIKVFPALQVRSRRKVLKKGQLN